MYSLIAGLFFLLLLGMQFGSQWVLLYLAIGSLIGVPLALLFQEAVEENTDDTKPKTLRNDIKRHFANYLKNIDPIERLNLELSMPLVVFISAIYIAVTWFMFLIEGVCLDLYDLVIKIKTIFFILRWKFLFWHYKRHLKKMFLNLHIMLSEEEKNEPKMRLLLENIRLVLKNK